MTTIGTGNVTLRDIRDEFGGLTTATLTASMLSSGTFTSGSGTITAPANANLVLIHLIGGGGGGGRSATTPGGSGGGGGGFVRKMATVAAGDVISYTVGSGGTGRTVSEGFGTSGGATTTTGAASVILSAGGGAGGGFRQLAQFPSVNANGGAVSDIADGWSSPGQIQGPAINANSSWGGAAGGASSFWLAGQSQKTQGSAGNNYGGGGAGSNTGGGNGGNGAGGLAQFTFYNLASVQLTSYYEGVRVPPHQNNDLIPESGTIKIGDFRSGTARSRGADFLTTSDYISALRTLTLATPAQTTYWQGWWRPRPDYDPSVLANGTAALGTTGTIIWVGTNSAALGTYTVVAYWGRGRVLTGNTQGSNSHFAMKGRHTGTWWNSVQAYTTSNQAQANTNTGALLRAHADTATGLYNSVYNFSYWDWTGPLLPPQRLNSNTSSYFTMTLTLNYF